MPYDLTWERHGVYKKFSGKVTAEEFMESSSIVYNDPRFDRLLYTINDFLDVTETSITKTDTVKICGYGIGSMFTNPRLIRATVARDRTIVDLLTFFKTPFPLEVFASLEYARMWVSEKKLITFA